MEMRIIRSAKRQKSVTARIKDGVMEVLAPAHMDDVELQPIILNLQKRLDKQQQQRTLDDRDLVKIAHQLNAKYFQGQLSWKSITWSVHQDKRYGSCTPSLQTIRISSRLAPLPLFVKEYVLMHELAHLLEPNHGSHFWQLVNHYPYVERARGYLMALGMETETLDDELASDVE